MDFRVIYSATTKVHTLNLYFINSLEQEFFFMMLILIGMLKCMCVGMIKSLLCIFIYIDIQYRFLGNWKKINSMELYKPTNYCICLDKIRFLMQKFIVNFRNAARVFDKKSKRAIRTYDAAITTKHTVRWILKKWQKMVKKFLKKNFDFSLLVQPLIKHT